MKNSNHKSPSMTILRSDYNRFNPVTCVPVPSQDLDFQHHVIIFFCVHLFEVRGGYLFVEIGGVVDYHCLNFLFISLKVIHKATPN